MRKFSYTQLKNLLCPIKQYLSLNKKTRKNLPTSVVIGIIVHFMYETALRTGNFDFVTPQFVSDTLNKRIRTPIKISLRDLYDTIRTHIHIEFLQCVPEHAEIEKIILAHIKQLCIIPNIKLYSKPDIFYIENNTCTIIEIKTGMYNKYDKLQLLLYAWSISQKYPNLTHFVVNVFNTHKGEFTHVTTHTKKYLNDMVELHLNSVDKAYALLNVSHIPEVAPVIKHLIDTKSKLLIQITQHISPEQCEACPHSISCPVYQQEIIKVFADKASNEPSSNILSFCGAMSRCKSIRKVLVQQSK